MAKAKATKKKGKRKINPEWQMEPAIPDRPEHIDLSSPNDVLQSSLMDWKKKHQTRRPKTQWSYEPYRYHADLIRFVKTMERSPLSYKEHQVLSEKYGGLFLLSKKRLYHFGTFLDGGIYHQDGETDETLGVLLTSCDVRNKQNKDHINIILINGDKDADDLSGLGGINRCGYPTMSFECLSQFYPKLAMRTLIKRLTDNTLRVIDYSPDERRLLSKRHTASLKALQVKGKKYQTKKSSLVPPEFGFSIVGCVTLEEWHRSGYVLLEDTKQPNSTLGTGIMHLLFGQDEGTYFGCELPCACSSIDEALHALMPEEFHERNDLIRQGEWFMVPVDESEVPSEKDSILIIDGDNSGLVERGVWLPLDNTDSKKHFVHGYVRVSRDGKVYVRHCVLEHEDHEDAEGGDQWITFQKNKAVRSFSQEGVD